MAQFNIYIYTCAELYLCVYVHVHTEYLYICLAAFKYLATRHCIFTCVRICVYIFMCAYLGVDLFVCMGAWAVVFIFNSGLQGWED